MAKSKNHTAHNQTRKAHRNGIKKAKGPGLKSFKGVDSKFKRNQKFARRGTERVLAEAKAAAASA